MAAESTIGQAEAAMAHYGFRDFKLKGGVMPGSEEMKAVSQFKAHFPSGGVTLDPNGAWRLREAIAPCKGQDKVLAIRKSHAAPRPATPGG